MRTQLDVLVCWDHGFQIESAGAYAIILLGTLNEDMTVRWSEIYMYPSIKEYS